MRYWISVGFVWLLAFGSFAQADTSYVLKRDWQVGRREHLPSWLADAQEGGRFIGISDPGMKPAVAKEQALMRAAFLYALSTGVKISMVTDYFSFNHKSYEYEFTNDKLISMIRVEGSLPVITWRIGREWETQYGEAIVEVFPDSVRKDCGGQVFGEMMLVSSSDIRERNELRCEWKFAPAYCDLIRTYEYQLKGPDCDLKVCTALNDTVLNIPWTGYWYADCGRELETEGYRMNYSVWSAQVQSFLYALALYTYPEVQLKNLEEDHRGTGSGLKREVIQDRFTVEIESISVVDNNLFVAWKIAEPEDLGGNKANSTMKNEE